MNLLSALIHEVGHLLGHEHDKGGTMAETLTAGERLGLDGIDAHDVSLLADLPNAGKKRHPSSWWF